MAKPDEDDRPRLLVVEDHYETLEFLKLALVDNYEVDTATSAGEALEMMDNGDYALLLVDIALRDEIDGVELVAQLRRRRRLADLPIIATTAHQSREDRQFYLTHGFDDFLPKPFFPEDLFATIERLLKEGRRGGGFLDEESHPR